MHVRENAGRVHARMCRWLSLGIHVIAANKRLGSGPLGDYLAVREAQRRYRARFLAEVMRAAIRLPQHTLLFYKLLTRKSCS